MSLIGFMEKCKKEMEQLRKSFLEDFSSREGLLPNWFELDMYAKILLKRGDSLSEDKIYKEADDANTERKRVLAPKDSAKSLYDNATQLKDYAKCRIDECQKKRFFMLKGEYRDLLGKAKMRCDLGDTYEEPEPKPECLDPSDDNLGIVEEEEYDATSTEGNGNEDSDSFENPPGERGAPNEEEEESGPSKHKVHRNRCFRFFSAR
jgi:hypothetical protein